MNPKLKPIYESILEGDMEGAGFAVVDLGVDVRADKYVAAVQEHKAQIVAMSALLTTTMPKMKTTIEALKEASGIDERIKIIVGGAPVTAVYAESIGADGYAADASQAAVLAKSFVK
jgi:5-methyltetrahydrofolate--homocysteine methyltransferase